VYDTREERIAAVERELELATRAAERLTANPSRRRKVGSSIGYSVRLTPSEVDLLERQAAMRDIPPTGRPARADRIGHAMPSGPGAQRRR
jgi:hypothetical protein